MYQSPRTRRLHNDLAALERLRSESSVFRFSTQGDPPQQYMISLKGKGLWRDHGKVRVLEEHRVEIKLGASYPRTVPEIRWVTPIYHPNISEIGMVCLGGYGTHWVPSVQLDELCVMLWDMVRYHNYDIRSPYNREAALWVANQSTFLFPIDPRPVRDLRAALGRVDSKEESQPDETKSSTQNGAKGTKKSSGYRVPEVEQPTQVEKVRQFISRYGRIFINPEVTGQEPPEQQAATEPARINPQLIPNVPVTPNVPARTTIADNSNQTHRPASNPDELIILDDDTDTTVHPAVGVSRSVGDEILFIE
jgi:ubiquitin-protein ligase